MTPTWQNDTSDGANCGAVYRSELVIYYTSLLFIVVIEYYYPIEISY